MNVIDLTEKLKVYVSNQVDVMGNTNPLIKFTKPIINRAINKNFDKLSNKLSFISDENGDVDAELLLTEMIESLKTSQPFNVDVPYIGDVEIGNGAIKFNLPMTDSRILFNVNDIEMLKEMLNNK